MDAERLAAALALAEQIAIKDHDGHLTIMRMTTGWLVVYDTPVLPLREREHLSQLTLVPTLAEALERPTIRLRGGGLV